MIKSFALPAGLAVAVAAMTAFPRIQASSQLMWSFLGAAGVLLVWTFALAFRLAKAKRPPKIVPTKPRPQHYIQTFCHFSVYAYWGYYWPPVYDYFPLLVGQFLFAYAFDILLAWSRGEDYQLGWGPIPIVNSTNLFLWFKDDVYYWQFLLIAVGFLGKALVRWDRDVSSGAPGAAAALGSRRVHIFNPSAFSLALFSVVLIATGSTSITWGQEIATTFSLGPNIYTALFLIGLIVMYFFSITTVTAMAAITLVGLSALYYQVTGVPYFLDSDIPSAVFLGMHLLVTDPSTSPRTPCGRTIFGVLYGLGVFGLYSLLGAMGVPTFYDKLLCVPLLNLSAPSIDRFVKAIGPQPILRALSLDGPLGKGNLAHMGAWAVLCAVMTSVGAADGMHKGDSLPFWVQACSEGRTNACDRLLRVEGSYCADNAGWACNELGVHYAEGKIVPRDDERAFSYFARACEGRYQAGCVNALDATTPARTDPRPFDLRLLLREGGPNLLEMPEPELKQRACKHGWSFACS
ncbi:MAG: RnfABCDGE type electron transport complex subunit D [Acidimicrobiia bacterium]